ncbi:MAG TPA: D-glycero-beta-D-manno-heptose-7-phosphate kinase [bacterium]
MITITGSRLDWLFEQFRNKKIIVLGDLMMDRYVWGTVNRISPEAPVPIVEVTKEFTRLGGAANVANNLFSLGATPIPIGIVGNDVEGKQLIDLMKGFHFVADFILKDESRATTVKTRIIANDQHVVRADRETRSPISPELLTKVVAAVENNLSQADAIIIQDYNKGLLTKELIAAVTDLARQDQKIITVDPKFDNFFEFKFVTLFKPNRKETEAALGIRIDSLESIINACRSLISRLSCQAVLITLGDQGMCFLDSNGEFAQIPTKARSVHDVSGAGDTVISTLTLALTTGIEMKEAITLATYAAGVVCGEVGVVPIEPLKLRETILHFN